MHCFLKMYPDYLLYRLTTIIFRSFSIWVKDRKEIRIPFLGSDYSSLMPNLELIFETDITIYST